MKRLSLLFVSLCVCATPVWAEATSPLTTLQAVAALTNAQASQHPAVSFEATVTFYFREGTDLTVQDGDVAVWVRPLQELDLAPGDRILVEGTMRPSFLPFVVAGKITLLRHGEAPKAVEVGFDELLRKQFSCRLVRVHGIIRTADVVEAPGPPPGRLQLLMDGGYIDVHVVHFDPEVLKKLLDSEVEVTGAAGRLFDSKMHQTGAKIKVWSLSDIHVLHPAQASPWTLPVTPLGEIIAAYHVRDLSKRIRVQGTLTYYQPGVAAVVENESSSVWVSTAGEQPLRVGDAAEAIGFPAMEGRRLSLVHAEIADLQVAAPVKPVQATSSQLAHWAPSAMDGHEYDLVSTEGRVVTEVREAAQDDYVLFAGGRLFTAVYRHPPPPRPLPPMLQVPLGSMVRVTGVCMIVDETPFNGEAPFNILLRSFSDIAVVSRPSLLNVRNLIILVAVLMLAFFVLGSWSWRRERRRRRETAVMADLERKRSKVLEEVNSSRPLKEILEHVTELVSFRLHGSVCWCEMKDGPSFGRRPAANTSQLILEQEIRSRSGAPLGTLFAAVPRVVKPSPDESAALQLGAGLAKLAIETSNLYSALVYRSEFDLLTGVPNRFSLEKQVEALIDEARTGADTFGFIFIDLDRFKQINDQYGHRAGDVYLQEVAQRMKHQLRPGDMLARLGGDEFAVVVPAVHNRKEVEEIARRLERCFDEAFATEGHSVHGSASVGIALYPEDATNRDSLLSTADAAMYAVKQARKRSAQDIPDGANSDLATTQCA